MSLHTLKAKIKEEEWATTPRYLELNKLSKAVMFDRTTSLLSSHTQNKVSRRCTNELERDTFARKTTWDKDDEIDAVSRKVRHPTTADY